VIKVFVIFLISGIQDIFEYTTLSEDLQILLTQRRPIENTTSLPLPPTTKHDIQNVQTLNVHNHKMQELHLTPRLI